jgi:hypothetical protein
VDDRHGAWSVFVYGVACVTPAGHGSLGSTSPSQAEIDEGMVEVWVGGSVPSLGLVAGMLEFIT